MCSKFATYKNKTIWNLVSVKTSDKKFLKTLGTKIKVLRKLQNISQDQLAYECELHRTNINRIEKGKLNTGILNLLIISKALGVSLDELFDFED